MKKKEKLLTTITLSKETLKKIRLVSAFDGITTSEWLAWVVDKAYESCMIVRKKSKTKNDWFGRGMGQSSKDNLPPGFKDNN